MKEKKYILISKSENSQYLGMLNGKRFVLEKDKPESITQNNLKILKDRKWFNHLVALGAIEIKENSKKKESIEVELE